MKQFITSLFIACLVIACHETQKNEYQNFIRLINGTDSLITFNNNLSVGDIYNQLNAICNDLDISYTGDYYLLYNIDKQTIDFTNSEKYHLIKLRFMGFLCPYSTKDIFYKKIDIIDNLDGKIIVGDSITSFNNLSDVIKTNFYKKMEIDSYPVLMNIIAQDTLNISELSGIISKIIDGYYLYFKSLSNFYSEAKFLETFPLKIRITPSSYENKQKTKPIPPDKRQVIE